ncbi:MAG: DUF2125 domain-containing protein [Paracoccaceae bacterium]|nr:MAG: DUF2125 domain-containing protein [Paracoccaceae bacterium]
MTHRGLFGVSALCTLLSTTALHAQVTPEQVWQNWKDLATGYGQTVSTGSESRQGDTLVITGMTMEQADGDVAVTGTIDEVRFRDLGNGTVEVTMSPTYPLTMNTVNAEGEDVEVGIEIAQDNLSMIAGGTPDNTTYDFTADSMVVSTTSVIEAGEALPVKFNLALEGAGGKYVVNRKPGDVIDLTSGVTAGNMVLTVAMTDPAEGTDVQINATVAQLSATSSGTFGSMMDMEKLSDALNAGFAVDVALSYGPIAYDMNVTEDSGPTSIRGKTDGGSLALAMDRTKLAYKGGARAVEVLISSAQIPFPEVAIRYAETAFDLLMPISKGDAPQEYRLGATLRDLTVSDEIWAMFDPMQNLSRDPATLVIDARGTATLSVDIMDEEAMNSGMPPGTLDSFDLPALQLKIAGAELTGNGALTFDNTDLVSFDGVPAPTGTVNLALSGGNALLDKLVAMGLVPDEQAMGARMMMGMFARPGTEPDTLTSTLEFKDKGFFANGMRLK